jgi:HEAT repeat protein
VNPRRIVLILLALSVVYGIGSFVWNRVQTSSQLALVGGKEATQQEQGVKSLMDRGVLFDALQGGAPKDTRLTAVATLQKLAESGKNPAAFKELLQMLKDPDTESVETKTHPVRDAAKEAITKVGAQYIDLIFAAAKDPDGNIKDQTRNALKAIGRPLKDEMAKRLGDPDLRSAMGDMLASIGPDTIPLIVPYLQQDALSKFTKPDDLAKAKIQLLDILGKFSVPEAATPALPFIRDADPNVRRAAVTSLANISAPEGAPALIAALSDPNADPAARTAAAVALGGIATPEANTTLTKALGDFDLTVATAATAGLRRAAEKASANVAQALKSPDEAIRARAAEAAGGMRSPTLAASAIADPSAAVRSIAINSLSDILAKATVIRSDIAVLATATDKTEQEKAFDSLQTRGALLDTLSNPAAQTNALAVISARSAAAKDDDARKPFAVLTKKLTDPATRIAQSALPPLADPSAPNALAPLLKALGDTEGAVAENAVTALGRVGAPAVAPLVSLLGGANDTVAYYASQALSAIQRPAVDALVAVAVPANPAARWAAITLGEIGDARARPALEALAKSPDADTAYAATAALARVKG